MRISLIHFTVPFLVKVVCCDNLRRMNDFPKHILFIRPSTPSTSSQRSAALSRLGCNVTVIDPYIMLGSRSKLHKYFDYRTGYFFLQRRLFRLFLKHPLLLGLKVDLVWVDSGELIGPSILKYLLHSFSCPSVLYCSDDPTGVRDGQRFLNLKHSLPLYSLCVFLRPETSLEALSMGANRVLTVQFSFDEQLHKIEPSCRSTPVPVVSFSGAMIRGETRAQFLAQLIHLGISIRIRGNHWQKSFLWKKLKHIHQGPSLKGSSYAQFINQSAINSGFLSHGNRDHY